MQSLKTIVEFIFFPKLLTELTIHLESLCIEKKFEESNKSYSIIIPNNIFKNEYFIESFNIFY